MNFRAEILTPPSSAEICRLRLDLRGMVQGVGFRPFVYRLARALQLTGWVGNTGQGVAIEVEGPPAVLDEFVRRLQADKPEHCVLQEIEQSFQSLVGGRTFAVRESDAAGPPTALILPDLAVCADCLRDIGAVANRRYRYPFTNCTHCGPRFSILEALPYDRANTTMNRFVMCAECQAEYDNPADRRFHAQPNACPRCGPHLALWDPDGQVLTTHDDALQAAAKAIRQGAVVAVKGLGGFHLFVHARDEAAVRRLRHRKNREEKPLALMAPDLAWVKAHCQVSPEEQDLLRSAEAPIVLVRRKAAGAAAPAVAPGNPYLGVLLPYTPLHHLLLAELQVPVVATSGNRSDEPICIDEGEALERLRGIADLFLVHDRPIVRHVDDSVVRVVLNRPLMLRRARGYAPVPLTVPQLLPPLLAVGGHLKNTVALAIGRQIYVTQHLGDLDSAPAYEAFQKAVADPVRLYHVQPLAVACDAHPDYLSTRFAEKSGLPIHRVQHHLAHVRACMAENEVTGPVLGVVWDGTGYGLDGTIWGGEFLRVPASRGRRLPEIAHGEPSEEDVGFLRLAYLRTFPLPGGEQAIRQPRRSALGLLYALFGDALFTGRERILREFSKQELRVLQTMLARGLHTPATSSAGRLFDAVASLVGLRQRAHFEGQAAMELEFALDGIQTDEAYPFDFTGQGIVDWAPLVYDILNDTRIGVPLGLIAARFHNTLVAIIIEVAHRVGVEKVVLTGGCFQNAYLVEHAVGGLRKAGHQVYWHRHFPPNDGSIALGQILAAADLCAEE